MQTKREIGWATVVALVVIAVYGGMIWYGAAQSAIVGYGAVVVFRVICGVLSFLDEREWRGVKASLDRAAAEDAYDFLRQHREQRFAAEKAAALARWNR